MSNYDHPSTGPPGDYAQTEVAQVDWLQKFASSNRRLPTKQGTRELRTILPGKRSTRSAVAHLLRRTGTIQHRPHSQEAVHALGRVCAPFASINLKKLKAACLDLRHSRWCWTATKTTKCMTMIRERMTHWYPLISIT